MLRVFITAFSVLMVLAQTARAETLIRESQSLAAGDAIALIETALRSNTWTEHDSTAPQAVERHGPSGCFVSVFDVPHDNFRQIHVVVEAPASHRHFGPATTFDLFSNEDFATRVEYLSKGGVSKFAFHREGIDPDDGTKIDDRAYLVIRNDGDLVSLSDGHRSVSCRLK